MFFNPFGTPNLSKPVVAAVKGYCLGGGINRILNRCDIRIAGAGAKFGMPEVATGLMDLATPMAYQNVPTCFLAELFFTADPVPAERALQFGLINMVVPDDDVMTKALEVARRIVRHPPEAVQHTKRNLLKTMEPKESAFVWEHYFRYSLESKGKADELRAWVQKHESEPEK